MPEAAAPVAPPPAQTAPPVDDVMSRMESFATGKPVEKPQEKPVEPKPETKPPEQAKAPEKEAPAKETKPETKPGEKPAEKPAETPEAKTDKPAEPAKTPRPWEMYRGEKKAREELQAKFDALQKEHEAIRSQSNQPDVTKHPDYVRYKTRAEELENEIKFVNYEKSEEFKTKYLEPYNKSAQELTKEAMELVIEKQDEATGQVTTRALTADEFWNVVRQPNAEAAHKAAKNLFPNDPLKANDLLAKRKELTKSWQAMDQARQEYKTKGAEREKQLQDEMKANQARETQMATQRAEQFHQAVQADLNHAERKEFFSAPDDDPKGKEILTKGFNFADKAFGLTGENEQGFPEEEMPAVHAAMRNRAGSWPYLKHLVVKERARVKELEAKLAEYEKSEPGPGTPAGAKTVEEDTWEKRMEKAAVTFH